MVSRRARRAAFRFWFSVALFSALSVAPLAPAFAWTPPPRPLPMEPADTDGIDDDVHNDRPSRGHSTASLATGEERVDRQQIASSKAQAPWEGLELSLIRLLDWVHQR